MCKKTKLDPRCARRPRTPWARACPHLAAVHRALHCRTTSALDARNRADRPRRAVLLIVLRFLASATLSAVRAFQSNSVRLSHAVSPPARPSLPARRQHASSTARQSPLSLNLLCRTVPINICASSQCCCPERYESQDLAKTAPPHALPRAAVPGQQMWQVIVQS